MYRDLILVFGCFGHRRLYRRSFIEGLVLSVGVGRASGHVIFALIGLKRILFTCIFPKP